MKYTIHWRTAAEKQLARIRRANPVRAKQIVEAVDRLADNPRPAGCKKLRGRNGYRIRVGEYRVIYQIDDAILTVVIDSVSPRGGAYK